MSINQNTTFYSLFCTALLSLAFSAHASMTILKGLAFPDRATETFRNRTELITSAISLAALFYEYELAGTRFKDAHRLNWWLVKILPKALAFQEIYTTGRMLKTKRNILEYGLGFGKIIIGLASRLPEDHHREHALRTLGLTSERYIWPAPQA